MSNEDNSMTYIVNLLNVPLGSFWSLSRVFRRNEHAFIDHPVAIHLRCKYSILFGGVLDNSPGSLLFVPLNCQ